ncbi:MAG TPA: multicopper oxidase domain-containing protein [Nitrososphaeraceae archaeon]|nr:multicopper oxidase domain-containing protein [Nitrososphaeraceae archaeon]
MYIKANQIELKQLTIAIVIGLVLTVQTLSIQSVLSQSTNTTITNKLNSENHSPKIHEIKMAGVELSDGHQAYKMLEYKIIDKQSQKSQDITSRYSKLPTIPGPTLVMTEGDQARLTLVNEIGRGQVSLHTHGAHYEITSDGTLKMTNKVRDQGATPPDPYTYVWTAAEGTRGSWPWHDHTFGKNPSGINMNGVETNGLFSTVIINPADGKVNALVNGTTKEVDIKDIKKEFVLFITDDAFWGVEIDNTNNSKHTPLWVNPTLVASKNDLVRFHIQSVGTDFHHFVLDNYKWLKPGTSVTTSLENIGPLENHVFTISADKSTSYYDKVPVHLLSGMKGKFEVVVDDGSTTASVASIPGPSPEIQNIGDINGNEVEEEISSVVQKQQQHRGM